MGLNGAYLDVEGETGVIIGYNYTCIPLVQRLIGSSYPCKMDLA